MKLQEPKVKRDLLSIFDLSKKEIEDILARAAELKAKLKAGIREESLKGKTLAMIFEKPSSRTRISFEVGMYQLGGQALFLAQDIQLGIRESIPDSGRLLSRYVNGIMMRTFGHEKIVELAQNASIPVINGLSDLLHPCQILSDVFTIKEVLGDYKGVKVAYVGDGNNIANSLLEGSSLLGINLAIATPQGYEPDAKIRQRALEMAKTSGATIEMHWEPSEAVQGADIIYTDVWTSMGQEAESQKRVLDFQGYQVDKQLVEKAKSKVWIMHCLPVHRGEEISAEVIDGEHSIVFDQAENRLHVQKAILEFLMG
ncbi:MAG: ornithine carbamoyltransferase [Candidatus Tectomicrobia bacterium]|uniref:Ornithine carbamoyltransferase n=1 Tax=Tectimicrobiota bacterium TaxID=2528274 RepID=A0A933LRU1_UNCTE|nr:ornithine carbamoyltransferase [Candidatus Tectomicrobia bacterium]